MLWHFSILSATPLTLVPWGFIDQILQVKWVSTLAQAWTCVFHLLLWQPRVSFASNLHMRIGIVGIYCHWGYPWPCWVRAIDKCFPLVYWGRQFTQFCNSFPGKDSFLFVHIFVLLQVYWGMIDKNSIYLGCKNVIFFIRI